MMSFRQASVLIVDDSPTMRNIVAGMLGRLGVLRVEQADSGEQALAVLQNRSFTIIVSDWNMEPMNGLLLLRAVVRLQKPRSNRFLFMTTECSYSHRTTARIDGADDFICKPFQITTLQEKLQKILARC